MLAVSTMAVFYAAPVMAAEFTLDSNSSVTTETTTSTGGYTQNEVRVNIDDGVNGSQTIGTFYSNEMEAGFKTDYTMTASTFTLEASGKTWASLTVDGLTYTNPNTLNNVRLTADGLTFSNLSNLEDAAVLNAAAINSWNEKTQNIKKTEAGKTYFDGKVIADKFGTYDSSFYVDKNGTIKGNSLIIGKNGDNAVFKVDRNGAVKAANGAFYVDKDGNVTSKRINGVDVSKLSTAATDISDLQNKTQNMWAGRDYTTFRGSLSTTGSLSVGNGAVRLDGNYGKEAYLTLKDVNGNSNTLTSTQLGNINDVIRKGGVVNGADGSVIGGVGFTSGAMADVVSINGAAVEGTEFGGLKISDVTLEKGGIWADKLNGRDIADYVTGDEIEEDLANVGGITREAEDGAAPGEGTTTIENNLKVSGEKINMFGDSGLTFDKGNMNNVDVISVSGNIGFNGSNVHFSYGSDGKTTTLGGLALTVDQIATDVSAIKEKTDHITVDDKGNVTISADDGSSLTVGKDGTSTGQGGQVTTDGNHTVNGDLDVDGSGQIDKDLTVGGDLEVGGKIDASEVNVGNTHITKDNGIETDKITVSGQGGSAIINGGYVGGSNDVFIDANGNNIFDEGETSLSGVNGKVDKVASDLGDVSILDPEIAGDSNNDGQNDVVGAVNNEAEIRRNEIERVDGRINNLENRVGELEDRIDKVGAMAAAIANLRTMGYDPAAPTEVAVGLGQYRDETGAALGLFHYPNRDFMLSLSVSTSGDEVMGGIGATWKFGRKSPEKVAEIKKAQAEADARRAEEAKLAKAEEMKQAAKEAKIKAQQERHAKLAAERAAQAEAAK